MWDLIVSVLDHCLSFYFYIWISDQVHAIKYSNVMETSPCENDFVNPVLI